MTFIKPALSMGRTMVILLSFFLGSLTPAAAREPEKLPDRQIPDIDAAAPAVFETASFGLG